MVGFFSKDIVYSKRSKRIPTETTTKSLRNVLCHFEKHIRDVERSSPLKVMEAWYNIIDEKFSRMTRAVGFKGSVLKIAVDNSSFYSRLKNYDQTLLIKRLQKWVPDTPITKIEFVLG